MTNLKTVENQGVSAHGGIAQLGAQIAHLRTPKRAPNLDPLLQFNNGSPKIPYLEISGGIAQLGERLNGIQEVSGSIPLISTIGNRKKARFDE